MATSNEEILDTLCGLLEPFNAQKIELKPTTDISADLNIDSVSVMDFVMEVEDKYNIDIPLNLLSETRTLQELAAVVEQRISGS
jgi:acyl carrier protein